MVRLPPFASESRRAAVLPTFCVPCRPIAPDRDAVVAAEIVAPALEGGNTTRMLAPIPTGIAAFVAGLAPDRSKTR